MSWLEARLTGDRAREEWRLVLGEGQKLLLQSPLSTLISRESFVRSIDRVLSDTGEHPVAVRIVMDTVHRRLLEDREPLDRWVPEPVQNYGEELFAQPGLIDGSWVDLVMEQESTHALFAETLIRGLDEFSEMVPQMVQGLAPAGLGRWAARLQEAAGGVSERFREEMRRRLEPEVRKFAEHASRRLMISTGASVKAQLDEPGFTAARRNLYRHALTFSAASYAERLSPESHQAAEVAARAWMKDPEVRARVRSGLVGLYDRLSEELGEQPVSVLFEDVPIDLGSVVDWSFPLIQQWMKTEAAQAVLQSFSEELLAVITPEAGPSTSVGVDEPSSE